MAIDPRIALEARAPDISGVVSTFQNALLNAQKGRQNEQVLQQADVMNPLRLEEAQQGVDINSQNIAAARNESRFKNIFQTSQMLKPFIANNDAAGAEQFMLKNISRLQDAKARGEDVDLTESLETLEQIKAGNLQGVAQNITAIEGIAQQRMNKGMSAGQREFNQLAALAGGDKNLDITQAARIKLGLDPRASSSSVERIAKDTTLGKAVATQAGNVSTATEQAEADVQIPVEEQKLTQSLNIKRIKELTASEKPRQATIKKAKRFLKAFNSGTESGATRAAWSLLPGVFTDQAGFDEQLNAFSEVAARQQLKAAGEIRPTDADVEGMKRAMFGVGRDEATNIQLLEDYISDQEDVDMELDELRDAKESGILKTFTGRKAKLSEADIFANYGIK
mgnify:CR=1 FL=1